MRPSGSIMDMFDFRRSGTTAVLYLDPTTGKTLQAPPSTEGTTKP